MSKPFDCIVLAGGKGTRLRGVVQNLPKPMAPVVGRPFLSYLLRHLASSGARRVILSVGYMAHKIEAEFGSRYQNLEIIYSTENRPLGTGGAVKMAMKWVQQEHLFVLNGDTLFLCDLANMGKQHTKNNADLTIGLKFMKNAGRFGSVAMDDSSRIWSFCEKKQTKPGYINAGIYFMGRNLIDSFPDNETFSLERDFFEPNLKSLNFLGVPSDGYFIDIGIPEDYNQAQYDFKRIFT